jgi:hypothetical protein
LTDVETEIGAVKTAVDGVAGDYDIRFHVSTDGDWPDVSIPGSDGGSNDVGWHSQSTGGSFAKGALDIPYDNFPALLHRDEMVLTATQARQYRTGSNNSFDAASLVGDIVAAIREGMNGVTVQSYLSGRDVTEDVSRNQMRQLKARRFAV